MAINKIAVMLSGGTDSTYAALNAARLSTKIYLITFTRKGLRRKDNVLEVSERLIAAFKDHDITHSFIDFENIYQLLTPHEAKKEIQQKARRI